MAQNVNLGRCASLARRSLSARRNLDRSRRQFRALLRARDQGRAVPVRLAPTRTNEARRIHAARADRHGLARLSARRPSEPALRLPRPRPLRTRGRATASIPTRLSWIHTRSRWRVRFAGPTRCSGTSVGHPDADLSFDDARQRGVRAARGRRRSGVHLGRRPAAAHAVAQHGHLRDARARLHEAASRTFRSACAAPTKR